MFEAPYKQTEKSRRWLSWTMLTTRGVKGSYQGTANANAVAKRRAKNKVAKQSRRGNR